MQEVQPCDADRNRSLRLREKPLVLGTAFTRHRFLPTSLAPATPFPHRTSVFRFSFYPQSLKAMQNAHCRFGILEFTKHMKDAQTRVRVHVDRAILEPLEDERHRLAAHLISAVGRDSEIGAVWAGISAGATFEIQLPGQPARIASMGQEALCFRGTVVTNGREGAFRHLVAVSSEMAKTKPGSDRMGVRTVLSDDDPVFVLYRMASRFGLPVAPAWASWFVKTLKMHKAIRRLAGLGCSPLLVNGSKETFLKWIGDALSNGSLQIPTETGPISWELPRTFLEMKSSNQH